MNTEILNKISKKLKKINFESDVLYVLAEIRKYIEEYSPCDKNNYPNLYFFCDWILHITMDRTPARVILKRFDLIFLKNKNFQENKKIFLNQEKCFYKLEDFKKELIKFLESKSLPTLISNKSEWRKFRRLLVCVLIDCRLKNKMGVVEEFIFEKNSTGKIQFRIRIKGKGSIKVTY